jgi:hypothetical protein
MANKYIRKIGTYRKPEKWNMICMVEVCMDDVCMINAHWNRIVLDFFRWDDCGAILF